jgi:hypothetical protein
MSASSLLIQTALKLEDIIQTFRTVAISVNDCKSESIKCGFAASGMTFVPNFTKIHGLVKKTIGIGTARHMGHGQLNLAVPAVPTVSPCSA